MSDLESQAIFLQRQIFRPFLPPHCLAIQNRPPKISRHSNNRQIDVISLMCYEEEQGKLLSLSMNHFLMSSDSEKLEGILQR